MNPIKFVLLLFFFSVSSLCAQNCTLFSKYNKIQNNDYNQFQRVLDLENVKNISEIIPECIEKKERFPNTINFIPNEPIILNMRNKIDFALLLNNDWISKIRLEKIEAFDTNNYLFRSFELFNWIEIEFYASKLKVINNNYDICEVTTTNNLFKKLSSILFSFSVKYSKRTCPLLFSFLDIKFLTFQGLSNTFTKKNILDFIENKNSTFYSVKTLSLFIYRYTISKNQINMFNNSNLIFKGQIDFIEIDTFFENKPASLEFQINSILGLFQDGGQWLNAFNYFIEIKIQQDHNNYYFPNKDICFFRNFPINSSIFLTVSYDSLYPNCTCSMLVLFSPYFLNPPENFSSLWLTYNELLKIGCLNPTFIHSCNLNEKFNKCGNFYSYYNDLNVIKMLEISTRIDFFEIILSEIISVLGVLFNFFNILILFPEISHKKMENDPVHLMNRLMFSNALINFIYFLINTFHILNRCVQINGIFCSRFYQSYHAQYYDIYMVEFIGSILKMWSSLSLIFISIKRFELLTSNHLTKRNFLKSKILFFIVLFSIIINLDKLFVVNINEKRFISGHEFAYEFPDKNTFLLNFQQSRIKYASYQSIIFYILYIVNFAINDVIFYIILAAFDIGLIKSLHHQIKKKSVFNKTLTEFENLKIKVRFVLLMNATVLMFFRTIHFTINAWLFSKKLKPNSSGQNICYLYPKAPPDLSSSIDQNSYSPMNYPSSLNSHAPSKNSAYLIERSEDFSILYRTLRNDKFVTTGFNKWKRAIEKFKEDEKLNFHTISFHKSLTKQSQTESVASKISLSHNGVVEFNKNSLTKIIQVIIFMAKQGISLRDNYFIDLKKFTTNNLNANYLSPEIQNELLEIIGKHIKTEIIEEIKRNGVFSLILDEPQIFVMMNKYQFVIDSSYSLDLKNLVGQCYHGSSNMSGEFKGLASRIKAVSPGALYFHYYAHRLNLALQDSCEGIKEVRNTLGQINSIYNLIEGSSKPSSIFEKFKLESNTSNILSNKLQEIDLDYIYIRQLAQSTIFTLNDYKKEAIFDGLWSKTLKSCDELDISLPQSPRKKKPRYSYRGYFLTINEEEDEHNALLSKRMSMSMRMILI
ncbi:unnamed protein product [Brachionus calyciflorus]|uniref:G-protein coupled receptors family 1 profile domain-containing protein n=1 Tax=Brachionus calyciflorus TaxID=104777 RepID=A0A814CVZ6_9BILA|nr:unnamed protein product [Brachionus calyciflorus]